MSKLTLGLDIGGRAWKMALLSKGFGDKVKVEAYAELPALPCSPLELFESEHEDEGFETTLIEWRAAAEAALAPYLEGVGAVAIGLPPETVSVRVIDVPFTQKDKIASVLPFEAEATLLQDVEEMVFDHYPLAQHDGHTKVMSAAISRQKIAAVLSRLKGLRFDPSSLFPTSLAFHQLAPLLPPGTNGGGRVAFLNIGEDTSQLTVAEAGATIFAANLKGGADELAAFAQNHPQAAPPELVRSIKRALHYLEGYSPLSASCPPQVKKLALLGAGAMAPRLGRVLTEVFGIEAFPFRLPPETLAPEAGVPEAVHAAAASALAVALQQTAPKKQGAINFRKNEFAYRPERKQILKNAIFPAVLGVLLAIGVVGLFGASGESDQAQVKLIRGQMAEAFRAVFPNRPVQDPLAQVEMMAKDYKAKQLKYEKLMAPAALTVLAAVHENVPAEVQVKLTALDFNENKVTISGESENLEGPNEIANRLKQVPIFPEVEIDGPDKNQSGTYRFKIRLEMKPAAKP